MNVKLLRKVQKHILEEPKRLQMWTYVKLKGHVGSNTGEDEITRPWAKCGTAACIAGWACVLKHGEIKARGLGALAHGNAAELLELNSEQANRLFLPDEWPEEFNKGFRDDGRKKTAEVAAARIDHFIKTKGRE